MKKFFKRIGGRQASTTFIQGQPAPEVTAEAVTEITADNTEVITEVAAAEVADDKGVWNFRGVRFDQTCVYEPAMDESNVTEGCIAHDDWGVGYREVRPPRSNLRHNHACRHDRVPHVPRHAVRCHHGLPHPEFDLVPPNHLQPLMAFDEDTPGQDYVSTPCGSALAFVSHSWFDDVDKAREYAAYKCSAIWLGVVQALQHKVGAHARADTAQMPAFT